MRTTAVAKRPARYHHGDLRAALVQAGQELLRKGGLEALSLRAVARRAGVSQTAPYSHFQDKSMLVAAVAAEGFRHFKACLEKAAAKGADPEQAMQALAQSYINFACEEPALFQLMFGSWAPLKGARFPELEEAGAASFAVLRGAVARRLGADDADPRAMEVALAALSMVHGLAHLLLDGKISPSMLGKRDRTALVRAVCSHLGYPAAPHASPHFS